jgi:hypothetical protein
LLSLVDQLPEEQRRMAQAQMQSLLERVEDMNRTPARTAGVPVDPGAPPLDIDKAWHGLHFVLCGVADDAPPPLGNAVLGGEPLGEDLGYGPCRFLTSDQVSETARALSGMSVEQFRQRYDAAALESAQIYPGGWDDMENVDWLADAFAEVSAYFRDASAAGDAMLLYLT